MTNTEYREARGTDKPFNCTEEQARVIWAASIRKDKWKSTRTAPTPPETLAAK